MRSSPKSPKRKRSSAATSRAAATVAAASDAATGAVASDMANDVTASDVTASSVPATALAPALALASNCTVKDAAALKVSLCAVADAGEPVVLDVGGVERIDTATIQLLCAFVRERVSRNQGIVWQGTSAALLEAARLLGVQTLLALPARSEC